MYTDTTLTHEMVLIESKMRQLGTISKCIWDWTCQKKMTLRNLRATCSTDHTLTRELVVKEHKVYQLDTISM